MNYIYFETTNGRLVTNYNISTTAEIVNGKKIDSEDFVSVREYVKGACNGILKEVKNPSVNFLIKKGRKIDAVKLYYDTHTGISLSEAKNIIEEMMEECKLNEK